MYIAYDWPKVISTEDEAGGCPEGGEHSGRSRASDGGDGMLDHAMACVKAAGSVVHLRATERLLLVVKKRSVQVWHRGMAQVKLGEYLHSDEDAVEEGEFRAAVWNFQKKSIVVLTDRGRVYIIGLSVSSKRYALPDGVVDDPSASHLLAMDVFVRSAFRCCAAEQGMRGSLPSSLVADETTLLLGCSRGELVAFSWNGVQKGKMELLPPPKENSDREFDNAACVTQLQYCKSLNTTVILLQNGMCALYKLSEDGLRVKSASSSFCWLLVGEDEHITRVSLSSSSKMLAVGTETGRLHLYNLHADLSYAKLRTITLQEWGYSADCAGPVSALEWTEDGKALAVLWRDAGLGVWSPFGCKLMSHMEKTATEAIVGTGEPVLGGDKRGRQLCWSPEGLQLVMNCFHDHSKISTYSFARACIPPEPVKRSLDHTSLLSAPTAFLLGHDRVLCIFNADVTGSMAKPVLKHLMLPATYMTTNWPAQNMAVSKDGMDIAISGERGVVLYNMKQRRWRMFGDMSQERQVKCCSLFWMDDMVVLFTKPCKNQISYFENNAKDLETHVELQLYPKYHLDSSSLLSVHKLSSCPFAVNSAGKFMVVFSGNVGKLDMTMFRVTVEGALEKNAPYKARAEIVPVKELCIVTFRQIPITISVLSPGKASADAESPEPQSCLVLHNNGELCHLDLDTGSEKEILDRVEHFWTDSSEEVRDPGAVRPSDAASSGKDLVSGLLWTYGARGINILYTSKILQSCRENRSPKLNIIGTDPELEYDREVYPVALFPGLNSIIGVSQHISTVPNSRFHGFNPLAKSHPVLSPLIRYLLLQGAKDEALALMREAMCYPHFSHSLEWLVFTVLEAEYSKPSNQDQTPGTGDHDGNSKENLCTLRGVINLVKAFPMFVDVIVRVARKVDPTHWDLLFSHAGKPSHLFNVAMQNKSLRSAAAFLVVVAAWEGPELSQECALDLFQETLQVGQYDLSGELSRFIIRSARDMSDNAQQWHNKSRGGIFSYFTGGSGSSNTASTEGDRVAETLQEVMSTHAVGLLAARRLQDLSALTRKSGFDIAPLLRNERFGVAQLRSFKEALAEIEKSLAMNHSNRIINQADCELLLEAFRNAGLTEWVVVLATILQRSAMLLNLFRGDDALWSVYIKNIKDDSKYASLVEELESGMNAHQFEDQQNE